jgi:hypothetical protein
VNTPHRPVVRTTDRLVVLVVGIALLALGLLAIDWRTGTVWNLDPRLDLAGLRRAVDSGWWPWIAALVGVLLVLLALRWVLALLPGRGPGHVRLPGSDQRGTLELDLRAVASVAATRLQELGPLTGVRHTTAGSAAGGVLELRARLEPDADVDHVVAAIRRCTEEVDQSTSGQVALRVLVDAPRRTRPTNGRVRIR